MDDLLLGECRYNLSLLSNLKLHGSIPVLSKQGAGKSGTQKGKKQRAEYKFTHRPLRFDNNSEVIKSFSLVVPGSAWKTRRHRKGLDLRNAPEWL